MHENREISEASRSNPDRDRSAKAQSHKADMHVSEKSDCAVVPVNQLNKGESSPAEVGEGRARTKENIVRSNTSPTQSGERVSQGLSGVRQAAKERKQERFTALLHHMTVGLLRDSFYALKREAAPGIDGVTWKEYETGLDGRIADLHNRVHRGAHEWAIKFVEHRVADHRVLRLIQKWLKAGVSEDSQWSESKVGTPQGAVVTPRTQKITWVRP
jgi:RNA-directed DNA polymerase